MCKHSDPTAAEPSEGADCRRAWLKPLILFLILPGFLLSGTNPATGAPVAQGPASSGIPVYTGEAVELAVSDTLVYYGRTHAMTSVDVYSTFGGDVVAFDLEEGDRVSESELVARVRRVDPGVRYEPERIIAPLSGIILNKYVNLGSRVTPQQALVTIVDEKSRVFRMEVPEIEENRVPETGAARVELMDGRHIASAPLLRRHPGVDAKERVVLYDLQLPADSDVLVGISGRARIISQPEKHLAVPTSTVLEIDGHTGVYSIRNGRANWRPIDIVRVMGPWTLLASPALAVGDTVITFGHESLRDGDAVSIREDPHP